MKNKSQLYDINRPRPRYGPKYTKYKMFVSIIVIYIKQYLNNIWRFQFMKKVSSTETELKRKRCI